MLQKPIVTLALAATGVLIAFRAPDSTFVSRQCACEQTDSLSGADHEDMRLRYLTAWAFAATGFAPGTQ